MALSQSALLEVLDEQGFLSWMSGANRYDMAEAAEIVAPRLTEIQ